MRLKSVSLLRRCCLILLLSIHLLMLAWSCFMQSPTLNEPGHLVAGLTHWETGKFSLFRVNPPLVRMVAAMPVLIHGYKGTRLTHFDRITGSPVNQMGEEFIKTNGRQSIRLFRLARLACIPFSALGALICFVWARQLFGIPAGFMACFMWCFSPMILGHAALLTPDAHATSLGVAACFFFQRWLQRPSWRRAIALGVMLGLAQLSKSTFVLFFPLLPGLWFCNRLVQSRSLLCRATFKEAVALSGALTIAIYMLNLGYGCSGTFSVVGKYRFVSELFTGSEPHDAATGNRWRESWAATIPLPLPSDYVRGIDQQQKDFEDFGAPSYIRGNFNSTGWWFYYMYAIAVKAPVGMLLLLLLSAAHICRMRSATISFFDAVVLLSPAIVIFVVASSKYGFSHHSRYVLPCLPFAIIWVSQLAGSHRRPLNFLWTTKPTKGGDELLVNPRYAQIGTVLIAILAWSTVSSIASFPHSISYFNELAGGPRNGALHLLNSNIDWGQDLPSLEQWIAKNTHGSDRVFLAFDNLYTPLDLEVPQVAPWPLRESKSTESTSLTTEVPEGYYAISINQLYQYPFPVSDEDGRRFSIDSRPLEYLRLAEPFGNAGYSIRVFSRQQIQAAYASVGR